MTRKAEDQHEYHWRRLGMAPAGWFMGESLDFHFWQRAWLVLKTVQARLRFVLILVAIGVLIASWDTITAYYEKWTRPLRGPCTPSHHACRPSPPWAHRQRSTSPLSSTGPKNAARFQVAPRWLVSMSAV